MSTSRTRRKPFLSIAAIAAAALLSAATCAFGAGEDDLVSLSNSTDPSHANSNIGRITQISAPSASAPGSYRANAYYSQAWYNRTSSALHRSFYIALRLTMGGNHTGTTAKPGASNNPGSTSSGRYVAFNYAASASSSLPAASDWTNGAATNEFIFEVAEAHSTQPELAISPITSSFTLHNIGKWRNGYIPPAVGDKQRASLAITPLPVSFVCHSNGIQLRNLGRAQTMELTLSENVTGSNYPITLIPTTGSDANFVITISDESDNVLATIPSNHSGAYTVPGKNFNVTPTPGNFQQISIHHTGNIEPGTYYVQWRTNSTNPNIATINDGHVASIRGLHSESATSHFNLLDGKGYSFKVEKAPIIPPGPPTPPHPGPGGDDDDDDPSRPPTPDWDTVLRPRSDDENDPYHNSNVNQLIFATNEDGDVTGLVFVNGYTRTHDNRLEYTGTLSVHEDHTPYQYHIVVLKPTPDGSGWFLGRYPSFDLANDMSYVGTSIDFTLAHDDPALSISYDERVMDDTVWSDYILSTDIDPSLKNAASTLDIKTAEEDKEEKGKLGVSGTVSAAAEKVVTYDMHHAFDINVLNIDNTYKYEIRYNVEDDCILYPGSEGGGGCAAGSVAAAAAALVFVALRRRDK